MCSCLGRRATFETALRISQQVHVFPSGFLPFFSETEMLLNLFGRVGGNFRFHVPNWFLKPEHVSSRQQHADGMHR
jgi:hypothetical protein